MYWRARYNEQPDYHNITEVQDEWLELRQVFHFNGKILLDRVLLDLLQVIPEIPFDGAPSREQF